MQVVECGQLPLHHRLEFTIVVDRDSRVLDDHDASFMHALRHRLNAQSCQLEQRVMPHIAITHTVQMRHTLSFILHGGATARRRGSKNYLAYICSRVLLISQETGHIEGRDRHDQ